MKKLLFVFTVMFGLALTSCGNMGGSADNVDSTKVDSAVIDSAVVDSALADTLVVDSTVVDTAALSLLNK